MKKLGSSPSLLGFVYLNGWIGLMAWLNATGRPAVVTLLAGLVGILGMASVCFFNPVLGVLFPAGLVKACIWGASLFMIPMLLTADASRRLTQLSRGRMVTGIPVAKAVAFPHAAGFEFTEGRGRSEFAGVGKHKKSDATDHWYVVPFVGDDWTPAEPVTVWALHYNEVEEMVVAGRFRAGLVWDPNDTRLEYAREAIQDVVTRHRLQPHPQAVILEMGESLELLKRRYQSFLILALVATNSYWCVAVLRSSPAG